MPADETFRRSSEPIPSSRLTSHDAVLALRRDPRHADLLRDAYLDADLHAASDRFTASAEFAEVVSLLNPCLAGGRVLDLGSGRSFSALGLARAGARCVLALEPDPSSEVGWGAAISLPRPATLRFAAGTGEALPVRSGTIDAIYARQSLHHTRDLELTIRECARVLRPGGLLLATREHVADDERGLARFLAEHPTHALTGLEHAYPLRRYESALGSAGLEVLRVLGPWDCVVNAFPAARSRAELARVRREMLNGWCRGLGRVASLIPFARRILWRRVSRPAPGALFSFLARKPGPSPDGRAGS